MLQEWDIIGWSVKKAWLRARFSARNKFSTVCAFSYALWRKKIDVHEALGRELASAYKKWNIQPCTDINIYFYKYKDNKSYI
jgi:hypothetical protein